MTGHVQPTQSYRFDKPPEKRRPFRVTIGELVDLDINDPSEHIDVSDLVEQTKLYEAERAKVDAFLTNCRRFTGWRMVLHLFFSASPLVRRILGGKWELWVHDQGQINAVLTWHPVKDWSEKFVSGEHVVAKRWYQRGRSMDHMKVFLLEHPLP